LNLPTGIIPPDAAGHEPETSGVAGRRNVGVIIGNIGIDRTKAMAYRLFAAEILAGRQLQDSSCGVIGSIERKPTTILHEGCKRLSAPT